MGEYSFKKNSKEFNVEINVNNCNEEQKKLINSLGNLVISNVCLLNTKLLNTCLNLTNIHANELLENLSDYVEMNHIDVPENVRKIVDDYTNINNFKL